MYRQWPLAHPRSNGWRTFTNTESQCYGDRRHQETTYHQEHLETMMLLRSEVDLLGYLGLKVVHRVDVKSVDTH